MDQISLRSDQVFVGLDAEYRSAWSTFALEHEALQALKEAGCPGDGVIESEAAIRDAEARYRCARNQLADYTLERLRMATACC